MVRYFLYAGSVLLALLLVSDWYWSTVPAKADDKAAQTSLDKEIILRIRSAQKWPQKIDFDTAIPTIVPPPALVAHLPPAPPPPLEAAAALNKPALNAHAEARLVQPQTQVRKKVAVRRKVLRPAAPQIYAYPVASVGSPWRW
jgi:hypothetical protein